MSLWKIAWRSIQRRALASSLTTLSMALGVMLVVAVLLIHGLVDESFRSNSSLGYNMIVGAKGGRLQLVLNTVYYLSEPIENIPYSYFQEFLSADEIETYRKKVSIDQLGQARDGKYKQITKFAIPLCLGDYFSQYRIIGTTPDLFDGFQYDPYSKPPKVYEFSEGKAFETNSEKHGYFGCVVGAVVARDKQLTVGSKISAAHGDPEGELHSEHPFHVVGILEMSGTPVDRGVFVNIEGFFLMDGHAKPRASEEETAEQNTEEGPPAQLIDEGPRYDPLAVEEREVTAILIRTVNPLVTRGMRNVINEEQVAQSVLPISEIDALFDVIVRPIQLTLLAITVLICVVSGVSILVSIYNSMSDRQHEIAVMRALGAGRRTVMAVVLLESIFLSLGGGLLGWGAGHALIGAAGPVIQERTGVRVGFFQLAPGPDWCDYVSVDWLADMKNKVRESLGWQPTVGIRPPIELWLIPGLILLAVLVGFLPAMAAYRTDVARALTANP